MIVIQPVRVNESGTVLKAPYIVTDFPKNKDSDVDLALQQAKEYSGLSKYDSWNFLLYGTLSHGKISKDRKFDAQVNRIVRSSINKRK